MSFPFTWLTVMLLAMGVASAVVLSTRLPPRGLFAGGLTGVPVLGVFLTRTFC